MDTPDKRKYLKILGLTALATIVFLPDVVLDLTSTALQFLFEWTIELAHLLFEGLESMLDHLIEGLFETNLQSTQTIVFYLLLAIAAYSLYRLGQFFQRTYRRCQQAWNDFRSRHQLNAMDYWRSLAIVEKVKLIVISSALIYFYVMFFI